MKKFVILLFAAMMLASCTFNTVAEVENRSNEESMFVMLENTGGWYVVYHKDTKVMYAVSHGEHNTGVFTLMVDKEGKPLLYKGN